MKKNKTTTCVKCGKELSNIEKNNKKRTCEHCTNNRAGVVKILSGVGTVLVSIGGIALFIATRGKRGKF